MTVPTVSLKGINAIYKAALLICRLNGMFRPVYVKIFTGPELLALDTLTAACQEFTKLAPFGG